MAVSKAMGSAQRRLVFGANVIIQVALALVVLAAVVWAASEYKTQFDWTAQNRNSLSPRTEKLLENLEQDVTITAVYTVLSEYDTLAQKRQDMIRDLLDLYDSAGGARATTYVIDPMKEQGRIASLLERLREKEVYANEAEPHRKMLEEFPPLNQRMQELASSDYDRARELAGADQRLNRQPQFVNIAFGLQRLAREAEMMERDIQDLMAEEVPQYGEAAQQVEDYLGRARTTLRDAYNWMTVDGLAMEGFASEVYEFFQDAKRRYEALLADMDALYEQAAELEDVKLEEVYQGLKRWPTAPPVLVETAEGARVLPFHEVWPMKNDPGLPPDADRHNFAGEQAISSAILRLTQEEKTGVVFTYYGGPSPIRPDFNQMNMMQMRQMPRAPFQALNATLEDENFVTDDWDVKTEPQPPALEDVARTIYVVFPPTPPQQPNPMQPPTETGMTPEERQRVTDAVDASGMALFLAGWAEPTTPMPGATGTYQFAEYLKSTWGIRVLFTQIALNFIPSPDQPGKWTFGQNAGVLTSDVLRLGAHALAEPLQGMQMALPLVCPLEVAESLPEGVTVETILATLDTEDVWAVQDPRQVQMDIRQSMGTKPGDDAYHAPFAVALAAEQGEDQRAVVIASEGFASDQMTEPRLMLTSRGLSQVSPYPGNRELFVNALHWLSGDAERIAVGPRSDELPRLDELKEGLTTTYCRAFLVGIWPASALLIGGGVWLFRRR